MASSVTYVCEETGEIGSPQCKAARQRLRHANVSIAVPCVWHRNGCICGMEGRQWRRLTTEEQAVYSELAGWHAVETFDAILSGHPRIRRPVQYRDVQAALEQRR